MLNTEQFAAMERTMFTYYDTLRRMDLLFNQIEYTKHNLKMFKKRKEEILTEYAEFNLTPHYSGERTQGGPTIYNSPVEKAYIAMEENTATLLARQIDMQNKALSLDMETQNITQALKILSPFERKLIDYRYKQNMSFRQITRVVGEGFTAHRTVIIHINQILEKIYMLMPKN